MDSPIASSGTSISYGGSLAAACALGRREETPEEGEKHRAIGMRDVFPRYVRPRRLGRVSADTDTPHIRTMSVVFDSDGLFLGGDPENPRRGITVYRVAKVALASGTCRGITLAWPDGVTQVRGDGSGHAPPLFSYARAFCSASKQSALRFPWADIR